MKGNSINKNHAPPARYSSMRNFANRMEKQRNTLKDIEILTQSVMRNHLPLPNITLNQSITNFRTNRATNVSANKLNAFLNSIQGKIPLMNNKEFNAAVKKMQTTEDNDFKNSLFLPSSKRYSMDVRKKMFSTKIFCKQVVNLNDSFNYKPLRKSRYMLDIKKSNQLANKVTVVIKNPLLKSAHLNIHACNSRNIQKSEQPKNSTLINTSSNLPFTTTHILKQKPASRKVIYIKNKEEGKLVS